MSQGDSEIYSANSFGGFMNVIASMYGIYANIGDILMVNVTIYTSTMDPMGMSLNVIEFLCEAGCRWDPEALPGRCGCCSFGECSGLPGNQTMGYHGMIELVSNVFSLRIDESNVEHGGN